MTRASILVRLKKLEDFRDGSHRYGVILVPRVVDDDEWLYGVQTHLGMMHGADRPCPICGYPLPDKMIAECLVCESPPRQSQQPLEPTAQRWGVMVTDDTAEQAVWLFSVQREWCEQHGIGGVCVVCRYPMARSQRRCLVCESLTLSGVIDDDGIC